MTTAILDDEALIKDDIIRIASIHNAAMNAGFLNTAQESLVMLRSRVNDLETLKAAKAEKKS